MTVRRGGTSTDDDHRLLAAWAASCAEHVLPFAETARLGDVRPRRAIEAIRDERRPAAICWGVFSA
jgi:hypothetical protein